MYQVLWLDELDRQTDALLGELKLDASGAVLPECEALADGSKDPARTPLDTPDACVIRRCGKVYPFAFRMMLHIGDAPRAEAGRERNATRSHNSEKQKAYTWEELPVIAHLRNLVAEFFGLSPAALASANLYAYRGPAACLKPHQDGVPDGLQGPIVYSLSLSGGGGPWRYVWKTGLESANFSLPSGSVNVLGQCTNSLGTHSLPSSTVRAENTWRVSINFRPAVAPPPPAPPILFYSEAEGEAYGCFSNFCMRPFRYVLPPSCRRSDFPQEFRVLCAETAIMLTKAVLMGDRASAERLVRDTSEAEASGGSRGLAKRAKAIGRRVTNFDPRLWEELRPEIADAITLQKFQACAQLRATLLGTGNRRIAEASPRDACWGIGVGCKHPRAQDPDAWPASGNLLGKALERARETLGGEAVAKKRPREPRLCGPVHERPWGFFVAAEDAQLPEAVMAAASELTSPANTASGEGWQQMGKTRASAKPATRLRKVCGGPGTFEDEPPAAARALLEAAAAVLRRMGKLEEADVAQRCDCVSVNVYREGAKLNTRSDGADCFSPVVCVTLHASCRMAFSHLDGGKHLLTVRPGDIYFIPDECSWEQSMSHAATEHTASVSGRVSCTLCARRAVQDGRMKWIGCMFDGSAA